MFDETVLAHSEYIHFECSSLRLITQFDYILFQCIQIEYCPLRVRRPARMLLSSTPLRNSWDIVVVLAVVPLLGTNFLRVFAMVISDVLSDFDEIEHVLFEVNQLEQGTKG